MGKLNSSAVLIAWVLAGLGGTACMTAGTLDTARALPSGESAMMVGGALSYRFGSPAAARPTDRPPIELNMIVRHEHGLGHGAQAEVGLVIPATFAYSGGLFVGCKQQVLGGSDGPFAAALAFRGTWLWTWGGPTTGLTARTIEMRLIGSGHRAGGDAVYVAPQVQWAWERDLGGDSAARAVALGLTAGGVRGSSDGGGTYGELFLLYTPPQGQPFDRDLHLGLAVASKARDQAPPTTPSDHR